ncbi:MAG: hypothetical protein AAF871_03795 [Pseudomonadota bacterium]
MASRPGGAALLALAFSWPVTAQGASVSPNFIKIGVETSAAEETALFRTDLAALALSSIAEIRLNDSNRRVGGADGAFSGFDVDAIFLDRDGDAGTLGDQIFARSFAFDGGTLRDTGNAFLRSRTAGPLNGSSASDAIDLGFATLDTIDAVFFETGSLSLGDGGSLTAFFDDVAVGASLFLFVGEVGDNGETINGLIEVAPSSAPEPATEIEALDIPQPIPLPAPLVLLAGAIFALVGMRRLRF